MLRLVYSYIYLDVQSTTLEQYMTVLLTAICLLCAPFDSLVDVIKRETRPCGLGPTAGMTHKARHRQAQIQHRTYFLTSILKSTSCTAEA